MPLQATANICLPRSPRSFVWSRRRVHQVRPATFHCCENAAGVPANPTDSRCASDAAHGGQQRGSIEPLGNAHSRDQAPQHRSRCLGKQNGAHCLGYDYPRNRLRAGYDSRLSWGNAVGKKEYPTTIARQAVDGQQVEPALTEPENVRGQRARNSDRESARE